MTRLRHTSDCTASPTSTGLEPHLLTTKNVRTGAVTIQCVQCGASTRAGKAEP